jgi:tRNA(Ile)-lysidine synthase
VTGGELPRGQRLVVGVSGGQDSVCLLDALMAAGWTPVVAHVEHRMRGEESAADARFVAELARSRRLDFALQEIDVAAYARAHRLGLEEAARAARYHALASVVGRTESAAVAVGHTRDDQAETLLINMLRGTGPLGTNPLRTSSTLRLTDLGPLPVELEESGVVSGSLGVIRPLLRVTRADTSRYCREQGLAYRTDTSNLNPSILRNRVRIHLLPLLATFNPAVLDALARLASIVAEDEAVLDALSADVWRRIATLTAAGITISWSDWRLVEVALQRRLLRRAARELGVRGGWSFEAVESLRRLLSEQRPDRRRPLAGGAQLVTTRSGFRLATGSRAGGTSAPRLDTLREGG